MGTPALTDADRLRNLQLLTDAALSSLELEELLEALSKRVCDVLDVEMCAVLLLDEEHGELVVRAGIGIEEELERGATIPVGGGFAGRVVAERRPVILDDVERAELGRRVHELGIRSLLGVPLLVRDDVIGVLQVGSTARRRFGDDDTEMLRLAGERAALGIEHARLFELERAGRMRVEHVQAIADTALAHLEVTDLLTVLLPRIREILRADTCAVLLLDEGTRELVATAAVGIEEEVEQGVRIPVGGGFAGRVAAERRPVILDDVDHAHVLNPILREKGIKSLVGVPLLVQDDVIGVLHVGTLVHRRFTSDDVELLSLVAARVALAVERGRLHEQTLALEELKSNFVAIASHELRTPASSIYGIFATIAGQAELSPETRAELLQVGYEQADRLRRLTEQLLDLSQLDARRVEVRPEQLVLRDALDEIVRVTLVGSVPVELDVDPSGLRAMIDPMALDRIVSNLLINASRYGSPPIVVSAAMRAHALEVVVQDRGEGVPEELRPHIFDRFARAADARGPGLGLTIARAYANAHGGDLVFAADAAGARFELTLPQP